MKNLGSKIISTNTKPKVIVLMATYNGRQWVEQQIESIIRQISVDIYILIRDDGSEDGTVEFLKTNYLNFKNIEIMDSEIPCRSAGGNFRELFINCDLKNFEYVALADQDDIWESDKISTAINSLRLNDAEGYSSAVEAFWPNGIKKTITQSAIKKKYDYLYEGCGQGCTYVTTVELFRKIIDFCKNNHELVQTLHYHDWLVYLLTRAWGYNWIFDAKPRIRYRQHDKNEIGARSGLTGIYNRIELIRSGWYSAQIAAAIKIARKAAPNFLQENDRMQTKYKTEIKSKIWLCTHIYMHGRRKIIDRMVLIIAALLGWIEIEI